jgi:hypothetical protein
VYSGVSMASNVNALFFILRWDQYRSHKKRARTHIVELVFLLLVGSAGDIVYLDVSCV